MLYIFDFSILQFTFYSRIVSLKLTENLFCVSDCVQRAARCTLHAVRCTRNSNFLDKKFGFISPQKVNRKQCKLQLTNMVGIEIESDSKPVTGLYCRRTVYT